MRRSEMRPDALPHRGAATPLRVAIGLAVAASAGVMLWGVGTQSVLASEFGRNLAAENPMTLEDTVAELTAELAQVRAETAKLRENQSDAAKNFHVSGRASSMQRSALRSCAPPPRRTRRTGARRLPRSRRMSLS
jgi:hypothetical protein